MADLRFLVRPLLAAPFVIGGYNTFRSPQAVAGKAEDIALPIAEKIGLPEDPVMLVKISSGVQIAAGVMLALGIMPRVASLALAGTVVPTTLAGHPFWEQQDPAKKKADLMQFAKNAGMLGGLLMHTLDTGSRPSIFWSGRKAVAMASQTVADSVGGAYHSLPGVS